MPRPYTGKPVGNPQKEIDWKLVDELAMGGCDGQTIAKQLNICADTLYDRCSIEKGVNWSVYKQRLLQCGDELIDYTQFYVAVRKKNPTMLMYLGRVRRKQNDSPVETQEQINDLRKAVLEISSTVPGITDALRQKLENASSLQDQGFSGEMSDIQAELGSSGINSGSTSLPDSFEG